MFTFSRALPLAFALLTQALPGRATGPVLTMQLRPTYARPGQRAGVDLHPHPAQPRPLDL